MNSVARFLEARGRTADALEVATDPDYRFELAVQLSKLDVALEIAEIADSEGKWRQLSELAISSGRLQVFVSHCLVIGEAHEPRSRGHVLSELAMSLRRLRECNQSLL